MASKGNLSLLGMPVFLARMLGTNPVITSVFGAAVGSAAPIAGDQYLTVIQSSNSGSGLLLPQHGGDWGAGTGALLADEFKIFNQLSASIQIYCANNAAGSAVTLYINAVSAAGTTGVSLATGQMAYFYPITISTYVGFKSSV